MVCCLVLCSDLRSDKTDIAASPVSSTTILSDDCLSFNILNNKIRDSKISKAEALKQFQSLLPKIRLYFYQNGGKNFPESAWVFPLESYDAKAIGGTNGNGYITSKYNYFDGNKHFGHPAHDIFIRDKNQDGIDDLSNKPVNVLSMTGGIVIAAETVWGQSSELRGGKYIWIYDPYSNSLYYYAHNNAIFVQPSDIIKPGDIIATVGRTGSNAFKKRSPTHLHIMQLKLDSNNNPGPNNCYGVLTKVKAMK